MDQIQAYAENTGDANVSALQRRLVQVERLAQQAMQKVDALAGTATVQGILTAPGFIANAAAGAGGAGTISIGGVTQTTVGSAGSASDLPAHPTGYAVWRVAGVLKAFPYFDQA